MSQTFTAIVPKVATYKACESTECPNGTWTDYCEDCQDAEESLDFNMRLGAVLAPEPAAEQELCFD